MREAAGDAVEVRLYATLRQIAGVRSVTLDEGCATVGEVLDELIRRHPALREGLLGDDGAPRRFVAIMVGGRDIRHLDGMATAVAPDSEVDIFPPVAGGGR